MNLWIPGWHTDPLAYLGQSFRPSALVLHRTIGRWPGDYAVLSAGRVPSVHWLVGEEWGQRVQFYPTSRTAAHAAGANGYALGIELSGQNGSALTVWQQACLGEVLAYCRDEWGIAVVHHAPNAIRYVRWDGTLDHANVATTPRYTHYDYVNDDDFQAALGLPGHEEDDMFTDEDRSRLARIEAHLAITNPDKPEAIIDGRPAMRTVVEEIRDSVTVTNADTDIRGRKPGLAARAKQLTDKFGL